MEKIFMAYHVMNRLFHYVNDHHLKEVTGYIIFTADSFTREYSETSRTYGLSSDNKAFQSGMGGYSIYAYCLDGTDQGLRLEGYMRGENAWKIENCYMEKSEFESIINEIDPVDYIDLFGVTFFGDRED